MDTAFGSSFIFALSGNTNHLPPSCGFSAKNRLIFS